MSSSRGELIDQLDFRRERDGFSLVLQAIARADLDHLHTVGQAHRSILRCLEHDQLGTVFD